MSTDEYTKVDIVSVDSNTHNLMEYVKRQIPDNKKQEFYKYITRMNLDINKEHKSITVYFPSYDEKKFDEYVEGLITSSIAIGFEVYIKEQQNNVK